MAENIYIFALRLTKAHSALVLQRDGVLLDSREWPEQRDMGQRLFEAIAELLEKNGLQAEQVSEFVIESDIPEGYTSMRIA